MQPDQSRKLIRMLVERILEKVFPKETGAARLQQVGLFTLIYMLQGDDEPVTARRLAAMTGQSEPQVSVQLRKLVDIELIERKKIKNKQGRGHAFQLSIKHNAKTKRLAAAIHKAGGQAK
jgi:DNA-binding transcriptional regulator GbsR (MarR family)